MEQKGFYQSGLFWEKAFGQIFQALGGGNGMASSLFQAGSGFPFNFPFALPAASASAPAFDPQFVEDCLKEWQAYLQDNPTLLQQNMTAFGEQFLEILRNTLEAAGNPEIPPAILTAKGDHRFADEIWQQTPSSRLMYQLYLAFASSILCLLAESEFTPEHKKQDTFWVKQWLAALAPSNFIAMNPEVIQETFQTGGVNLWKGFEKLVHDWQSGPQEAFLALTKSPQFQVGQNLAITPGEVIFQNDLLQLIQYYPVKPTVFQTPLLIVPPWINKFYLFDLRPENSFVKWALEQGHTVFIISWVNPRGPTAQKNFEDYILQGLLPALNTVLSLTKSPTANLIGLCIGGELLACALSYLKGKGQENQVQSATFIAALMDFNDIGDMGIFLDPEHFQFLKSAIAHQGFMDGHLMALTFSMLRSNEMIWSPMIRRYFLGESPPPLDFLFWNGDPQRIAGPLHLFFLENFFRKNLLKEPGGISIAGVPCDLSQLTTPFFTLASLKDHIAPWRGCFPLNFKSQDAFVLTTSGHIAGTINPPFPEKYGYWSGPPMTEGPEAWLKAAQQTVGSWWPYWQKWVAPLSGKQVPACPVGSDSFPPLEKAPGSYVVAE